MFCNTKEMATKQLNTWEFTWNSENTESWVGPSPEIFKEHLENNFEQWCFQLERESRHHFQGHLKLQGGRKEVKNTILHMLGLVNNNDIKQLTVSPASNNGITTGGAAFYCMKPGAIDGPWCDENHSFKKKVKYTGKDLACMENPFPWQQVVIDWIKESPEDDRTIKWICNPRGCERKSKLMKYLCFNKNEFDCTRLGLGTATQLKEAACAKGAHRCWLVDLPRVAGNQESRRDLFSALEEIKNGWVETYMHGKPKELWMEPPHVIIMANDMPDLTFCSPDRWNVFLLENKVMSRIANFGAGL